MRLLIVIAIVYWAHDKTTYTISFNCGRTQVEDSETCLKTHKLKKWWIRIKTRSVLLQSQTVSHCQKQNREKLRDAEVVPTAGEGHRHTNLIPEGFMSWRMSPPICISTFYRLFQETIYMSLVYILPLFPRIHNNSNISVFSPFSKMLIFNSQGITLVFHVLKLLSYVLISGMFNSCILRLNFPLLVFPHL